MAEEYLVEVQLERVLLRQLVEPGELIFVELARLGGRAARGVTFHQHVYIVTRQQPLRLVLAYEAGRFDHTVAQVERGATADETREIANVLATFDLREARTNARANDRGVIGVGDFLRL